MSRKLLMSVGVLLLLSGCSLGPSEGRDDTSEASVIAKKSSFTDIPLSATAVKYREVVGLDRYEYLYFQSSRDAIDAFCIKLIGIVPTDKNFDAHFGRDMNGGWWAPSPLPGSRGGESSDELSVRQILIKDHVGYSEIWVFRGFSS